MEDNYNVPYERMEGELAENWWMARDWRVLTRHRPSL